MGFKSKVVERGDEQMHTGRRVQIRDHAGGTCRVVDKEVSHKKSRDESPCGFVIPKLKIARTLSPRTRVPSSTRSIGTA